MPLCERCFADCLGVSKHVGRGGDAARDSDTCDMLQVMARKFVGMLGLLALALGLGGCSQTEETCCALPSLDPEEFQRSGDSQFGTYDIGAPGDAQCEVTTRGGQQTSCSARRSQRTGSRSGSE